MTAAELPVPPEALAAVRAVLTHRSREPGALLPILHDVQEALGYVPAGVVPEIAAALNLSRAEVHGVVTYYHYFRRTPPGRHVVQICRAEACQSRGAQALLAHAEAVLGCAVHTTRADGAVSLEPVYCLGLCAMSPAVQVDDRLHGRVTPQALERIASAWQLTAAALPGTPQVSR